MSEVRNPRRDAPQGGCSDGPARRAQPDPGDLLHRARHDRARRQSAVRTLGLAALVATTVVVLLLALLGSNEPPMALLVGIGCGWVAVLAWSVMTRRAP